MSKPQEADKSRDKDKDKSKLHKLSLKGSSKLVAEFFEYSINTILYQRGVYPAEDFDPVKKYGLNMLVSSDDEVKAYIKKIMSALNRWMSHGKISKLVIVITDKATDENVERWQFDVQLFTPPTESSPSSSRADATSIPADKENIISTAPPSSDPLTSTTSTPTPKTDLEIQSEIRALFRQITASVTFLPELSAPCTFNVLVYADADSDVPVDWGDSDAREIVGNTEKVQLRSFATDSHQVGAVVSYRYV
ncbi:Mitotic spindle checkpoint component mad2 [Agyrium rufum]|nr:Mitotic spindle checkpoint component mad2 [Agyrium rufum]